MRAKPRPPHRPFQVTVEPEPTTGTFVAIARFRDDGVMAFSSERNAAVALVVDALRMKRRARAAWRRKLN